MDEPESPLPKALQDMLDAIESAGGKVKAIRTVSKEEAEQIALDTIESAGGKAAEIQQSSKLITRKMVRAEIAKFNLAIASDDEDFADSFGKDQNLYSRRSTNTVMCLVLRDQKALGHVMDGYREAAAMDTGLVDMPTAEELSHFQLAMGVGQQSFAVEVGIFGGAILGRGGFSNDEIMRLMNEASFTIKILTLRYRPEELCNLARETIERLDIMLADKN